MKLLIYTNMKLIKKLDINKLKKGVVYPLKAIGDTNKYSYITNFV